MHRTVSSLPPEHGALDHQATRLGHASTPLGTDAARSGQGEQRDPGAGSTSAQEDRVGATYTGRHSDTGGVTRSARRRTHPRRAARSHRTPRCEQHAGSSHASERAPGIRSGCQRSDRRSLGTARSCLSRRSASHVGYPTSRRHAPSGRRPYFRGSAPNDRVFFTVRPCPGFRLMRPPGPTRTASPPEDSAAASAALLSVPAGSVT